MESLSSYHIWPLFFPCELNVSINGIHLRGEHLVPLWCQSKAWAQMFLSFNFKHNGNIIVGLRVCKKWILFYLCVYRVYIRLTVYHFNVMFPCNQFLLHFHPISVLSFIIHSVPQAKILGVIFNLFPSIPNVQPITRFCWFYLYWLVICGLSAPLPPYYTVLSCWIFQIPLPFVNFCRWEAPARYEKVGERKQWPWLSVL